MRIRTEDIGKGAMKALGLFVLAVFLQWMGLPANWPAPPGTVYGQIASLVGTGPSGGHIG